MSGEPLDLTRRLRLLAEALPPDGCVTFSRADLERLVGDRQEEEPAAAILADLTVEEIAEELSKAESTVRGWIPRIEGAYKLGREWRVPRPAFRAWLDSKGEGKANNRSAGPVDLGSWRDHMRRTG